MTGGVGKVDTVGRIQVCGHNWKNTSLETPIIGLLKRKDGKNRRVIRKTAEYAGFKVSIAAVAAVTNALIVFLAEFRCAFTVCAYVCAREGKGESKECKNDGVAFANHSPGVH